MKDGINLPKANIFESFIIWKNGFNEPACSGFRFDKSGMLIPEEYIETMIEQASWRDEGLPNTYKDKRSEFINKT